MQRYTEHVMEHITQLNNIQANNPTLASILGEYPVAPQELQKPTNPQIVQNMQNMQQQPNPPANPQVNNQPGMISKVPPNPGV